MKNFTRLNDYDNVNSYIINGKLIIEATEADFSEKDFYVIFKNIAYGKNVYYYKKAIYNASTELVKLMKHKDAKDEIQELMNSAVKKAWNSFKKEMHNATFSYFNLHLNRHMLSYDEIKQLAFKYPEALI